MENITKEIKLYCRLDKLYKKVEELEKRTIDDWIEHLKFSKRYSIKNIEIMIEYNFILYGEIHVNVIKMN